MKKFLSLVLALVMTMSLVTVSAGAADFTDDSSITYEEAVDVMTAIGVVGGYPDGSFGPKGTLTRGAAAKIICNLILGTTTADALVADAAPYADVPVDNVFAGYIAYLAKAGVIGGYADGTFRPAATLTGYAFMKMLLGVIGLDATIEGYTGANWSIAVAKRALSDDVDLTDGLVGAFNGTKAVTREEACLYAFNAIKAVKFTYENKSTLVVGDVTVSSTSEASQKGNNVYYKDVFPKLTGKDATDAMGRPATEWKYNSKKIGTYAKSADVTYTDKVKQKDLWSDIDANGTSQAFEMWVDGVKDQSTYTVSKTSDTKLGGAGMITEVYYDYSEKADGTFNGTAVIVCTNVYFSEIDDVDTNDDDERIVTVDGLDYVTEEFEEGDKVLYTKDADADSEDQIQTMVLAEKQTGKYTKVKGSDVTIDGTVYTMNCNGTNTASVKDDVDFYLDANGYVIFMETSSEEADLSNLAYVIEADYARGDYAVLRLADGSKKIVDTNKAYESLEGYIVSFKDSDDGVKLTQKSADAIAGKTVAFTKGTPNFKLGNDVTKTDSKTCFLYAIEDAKGDVSFKVYTGYKAAPSLKGTVNAVVYAKDGVAVMVYVELAKTVVTSSAADMTFVAYKEGADLVNDGDNEYYELNAVVDGKITTVMVDDTVYASVASAAGAKDKVAAFKSLTYTSDDIATSSEAVDSATTKTGTKTKAEKNETIWVDDVALAYTDDVKVFFVDDCKFTEGKISSIREDNDGTKNPYQQVVYHLDDDGIVDIIFLVKK